MKVTNITAEYKEPPLRYTSAEVWERGGLYQMQGGNSQNYYLSLEDEHNYDIGSHGTGILHIDSYYNIIKLISTWEQFNNMHPNAKYKKLSGIKLSLEF